MPGRQNAVRSAAPGGTLAALLSLRTISGKLIVGLLVLFGLASVIVSVITAQSLNNSLMSSLNQQLVSATHTWAMCVQQSAHDGQHNDADQNDAYQIDTDDYGVCNESGQAAGHAGSGPDRKFHRLQARRAAGVPALRDGRGRAREAAAGRPAGHGSPG